MMKKNNLMKKQRRASIRKERKIDKNDGIMNKRKINVLIKI